MNEVECIPVADHALLVRFASDISAATTQRVQALDRAIAEDPLEGFLETVPALVSLLVVFDPMLTDHVTMQSWVIPLLDRLDESDHIPAVHVVDACYDEAVAADLQLVSEQSGLDKHAIIDLHTRASFTVGMYGFAPGYAYLTGTPARIQVPRKASPVRDVPIGSVMIAGAQCLITTLEMPTGWSVIGRTALRVLDSDADKPFRFNTGDTVIFRSISVEQLQLAMQGVELSGD